MSKKITISMEGIQEAKGLMFQKEIDARERIEGQLSYLTGTKYEKSKLHNLSPNEIIEKIIADLLTLKADGNFVNLNKEYIKFRKKTQNLEKEISKTKSEIEQTLIMKKNDVLSIPLKGLLKPTLLNILEINYEINSLGDLVKFCIENLNREVDMLHFKNVGKGEIKKIKELFNNHGINI